MGGLLLGGGAGDAATGTGGDAATGGSGIFGMIGGLFGGAADALEAGMRDFGNEVDDFVEDIEDEF